MKIIESNEGTLGKKHFLFIVLTAVILVGFQNCNSMNSQSSNNITSDSLATADPNNPILPVPPLPIPARDGELALALNVSCVEGCAKYSKLKTTEMDIKNYETDIKTLDWTELLMGQPDLLIKFSFTVDTNATLKKCFLDEIEFDCSLRELTFASPEANRFKNLTLKFETDKGMTSRMFSFFSLKTYGVLSNASLANYDGNFRLLPGAFIYIPQEPNHFWVSNNSTLLMQGRNFCIHRAAPNFCKIFLEPGAQLQISGSNVNTVDTEQASIYVSSGSVLTISGSNFSTAHLHIAPGAIVIATSKTTVNQTRAIHLLTENVNAASCSFATSGACPSGLVDIGP